MTTDATKTEKLQAIELIEQMPDEVSTETIVAELQFKLLVLRRKESAVRGEVVSNDEARRRLGKWLNYTWQVDANADLDEIATFIARQSPDFAPVFAERVVQAAERLAYFQRWAASSLSLATPNSAN